MGPKRITDDRSRWTAAMMAAKWYFCSGLRSPWEDHELLSAYRAALVEIEQAGARVRHPKSAPATTPARVRRDGSPDTVGAHLEAVEALFGKVRTRRWLRTVDVDAVDDWYATKVTLIQRAREYGGALRALKRRYDPLDRVSDYRLGDVEYRKAIQACTARYFHPLPAPPPREGRSPEQEDEAHQQRCDRRADACVYYGNVEVHTALLNGPFRLQVSGPHEAPPALNGAATSIGVAWLVLSHHRVERRAHTAERLTDRDEAYATLALFKSLVQYDPKFPRLKPGEQNAHDLAPTEFETALSEVDPSVLARTYELSLTRNAAFAASFHNLVDALRRLKAVHDPDDSIADYRTGSEAYQAAVREVLDRHLPPRITLLSLADELRDYRSRVRSRITGPAAGTTTAKDLQDLNDTAAYFWFAAEEVGLHDTVPPEPKATLDVLFRYFTDLLQAIESAPRTDRSMSNDLRVYCNSSGWIGVILRRVEDFAVYAHAAWLPWSDDDLANRAVRLSPRGGGWWSGEVPRDVPAGTGLIIDYYEFGTDSLKLRSEEGIWSGDRLVGAPGKVAATAHPVDGQQQVGQDAGTTSVRADAERLLDALASRLAGSPKKLAVLNLARRHREYSDRQIADVTGVGKSNVNRWRKQWGIPSTRSTSGGREADARDRADRVDPSDLRKTE